MTTGSVNPFATRFVRPGAIAYLFEAGQSAESLVGRLREQGWCGQIVGPHGSGKSTLLAALVPALEAAGRQVVLMILQQGAHRLPQLPASLNEHTLLIVDGYEQLGWFARRKLKSRRNRTGFGLLVTTHRDLGLPTLVRTRPSEQLAIEIVARLLPPGQSAVEETDIREAYSATGGNVREALFRLYDVYEARVHEAHSRRPA